MRFSRFRTIRGQATIEMALALVFGIIPLTLGFIAFVEAAWTYHGLTALTRLGAQYAATHCFQDTTGQNVVAWLTDTTNTAVPAFPDRPQLTTGGIQIAVQYSTHDFANGISSTPACSPDCSADCIPDSVTVSIAPGNPSTYIFNRFLTSLGLPTFQIPAFATTLPMESGVDPSTTP
jgi:hypothetical protein